MELAHYDAQEAAGLRKRGWTVIPPEDRPPLCIGLNGEGCPVRTPRLRCRWCNKTRRLRYRRAA